MSYADGIRLGMSVINDSKAAKIKEEELKAWREDREDKQGRQKLIDTSMEDTLASLSSPKSDTVSPFLTQQGLMPMSTYYEGEQGAYNRRQGFGAAPDQPTQAEPLNLPKRDNTLTMNQLKIAQAARDTAGFSTGVTAEKQAQLAFDAAQIQSYVTNKATPEQIKAFSDKYTGDARIPGKMKFDKATGMTTIDLDSGESVQLNKQQFGSYLAGMYRQEQGDPTAGASITAIHEALGKQADAIYNRQTGAVKVNNDVAKEAADQRYKTGMLGVARERVNNAGSGRSGAGGESGAPGVALKDRRDYLSDFSLGLEDPKAATDPAEAGAIQQRNQAKLVQADAIFSTNAEFGNVLTAPQARAAMNLAQDAKNVRKVRDNNTGAVYEVVNVNGKQIVVGTGVLQEPATKPAASSTPATNQDATPQPAPVAQKPAPQPSMVSTIDQMQADSVKSFAPLAAQVKQANAVFASVVKSGDPVAIKRYMDEKEALRVQLESAVSAKFGNAAPKVLQQLYSQ